MAVINLGTRGEPRKSPLSGLGEFTQELSRGRQDRELRTREEAGRNRRAELAASTSRGSQENQLQIALAGIKAKADASNQVALRAKHNQLEREAARDPEKMELFLNTPEGKQLTKKFKDVLGNEVIDEKTGKLILLDPVDRQKLQLESTKNDIIQQVKEKGPDSLTLGQKVVSDMLDLAGTEIVTKAFSLLGNSLEYTSLLGSPDQEDKKQALLMLKNTVDVLIKGGARAGINSNQFSNALGGGETEESGGSAEDFSGRNKDLR